MAETALHIRTQQACAWGGVVAILLFLVGFAISHMLPPPSPLQNADVVAAFYHSNSTSILVGNVFVLVSGILTAPTIALVTLHMRRREGPIPVMAYTQLAAGAVTMVTYFIPATMFLITAFRPDRPPEITYMMNDISWLMTVLFWPPFAIQYIAIAVFTFNERNVAPLFPRWFAWLNIVCALSLGCSSFAPFVKSGPFAWNGFFAFWLPASLFAFWFVLILVFLLRAIDSIARESLRDSMAQEAAI